MRIAVVGCGTAGAAAALFLARAGHEITVLERVPDPGPVGAGITLQPTGQAVMSRLGLLEPVARRGARLDRLFCRTVHGKTVVDLRYADVDPEIFGLGLHRGVLFETLFHAVRAEPGITLHCGVGVESLADVAGHDLVVVADGAVSELHDDIGIPHRIRPYPWGALWFVAADSERRYRDELHQVVDGARHMCGLLPTGDGPDGPVVSLFWSLRADRVAAWRAAGLDAWKADVLRFDPRAEFVVDQIRDPAQVLFTQYRDVSMRRWHGPGVVVLGDAAHATSPQLGQGANLALWDAMVLADVVTAGAPLSEYTRLRRRHLGYYQFATRALTPFFQGDSRFLGWLRDRVFPMSRWLGPLRRRMVRTMVGIDRGILRRPMPLADLKTRLLRTP